MYLVETDPSTGMVLHTGEHDGIMTIKEFKEVVNDKKLGIECLTSIALVVDWLSPIRHYSEEDRPKRAMYEVTSDRASFVWNQEKIQKALIKYSELQYNPDLVEKESLDNLRIKKLNDIRTNKDDSKTTELFKQLNIIKDLITKWDEANQDKNPFAEGPVVNGYLLSRLEEKLKDKHSFFNRDKN